MAIDFFMLDKEIESLKREVESLQNSADIAYVNQLRKQQLQNIATIEKLNIDLSNARLEIARLGLKIGTLLNKETKEKEYAD